MNYLLLLCLVYYQNFKRFHRVNYLEKGAIYHFWHIFYRFLSQIVRLSLCKNEFDDIFIFHHELSSSAMLSLLSKFQKISPCSFLRRGRYIPLLAYFFYRFLSQILRSLLCKNEFDDIFFFIIMNYLLLLCLAYYQNFKRFHRVIYLEEGAIYHFWHIFYRFLSQIVRPSLCKNEFDDIFFFHHELSSSAMLSLLSKFQKISPCNLLRRGRYIPLLAYHFWHIFHRFLSRILSPSLCKNEVDDIFFFHH